MQRTRVQGAPHAASSAPDPKGLHTHLFTATSTYGMRCRTGGCWLLGSPGRSRCPYARAPGPQPCLHSHPSDRYALRPYGPCLTGWKHMQGQVPAPCAHTWCGWSAESSSGPYGLWDPGGSWPVQRYRSLYPMGTALSAGRKYSMPVPPTVPLQAQTWSFHTSHLHLHPSSPCDHMGRYGTRREAPSLSATRCALIRLRPYRFGRLLQGTPRPTCTRDPCPSALTLAATTHLSGRLAVGVLRVGYVMVSRGWGGHAAHGRS